MKKTDSGEAKIAGFYVEDIRIDFPKMGPGSDAHNPHTTYSNPYLVLKDSDGFEGIGIGFSLGLGNEYICSAIRDLFPLIANQKLKDLLSNFRSFWRKLANPPQRRWLGPYCGALYMGAGVLANALFDLFSKRQELPLWKFLANLSPDETVQLIDFRYVEHLLTESEALRILQVNSSGRESREKQLRATGLPAYFTTWLGSDTRDLIQQIEHVWAEKGICHFKIKVGLNLAEDLNKLERIREHFGSSIELYADANQVWSPPQAVAWVRELARFRIRWIEEPTAPDSVDGHRYVREHLRVLGIEVVTGENCPNSHVAGHFISSGSVDRFQIDACRVLGPPENLLIMLVAKKFGVPICPHAGGSGLDELVPHLSAWNEVVLSAGSPAAITEHVALCSRHFRNPAQVVGGLLRLPEQPGYLVGMTSEAIAKYRFPGGSYWAPA